ncbi:hydrogenase 4 subunit F [Acetonema longum]|uniref:hydrogenase 4 subunit F n=1 Tax=Acetonema longum TaxID=2374 RepID=UPI001930DA98|nr:hydrogenase 4 subunit F [Acetonema longum]
MKFITMDIVTSLMPVIFELLCLLLAIPLLTGGFSLLSMPAGRLGWMNLGSSALTFVMVWGVVYIVAARGMIQTGMFYLDALNATMLLVIGTLSFTAAWFSLSYMRRELEHGHLSARMLSRYYALLQLFIFTMLVVLMVENLGLIWVAVEATTLASALLVAFYFNRSALEAAWKYVMVCTVGICLALLGTILLYYTQVNAVGGGDHALSWLSLRDHADLLDPGLIKLSFVFLLVGYGTKAGLAPMHTWLPDAHSQAPSPVSGLLSGALLSCALYALIRNMIIVQGALGPLFGQQLLLAFGVISVAVSIPFVLVQHDLKRLLAYSSVEHMGLVALGLGIGTPLAIFGALFHVLNHALAKSSLFYLAGMITQGYHTKYIMRISGLVREMPVTGWMFVLGLLAITGTPPFGVFTSKFVILRAAFESGNIFLGSSVLVLLVAVFAGMIYYCLRMAFGQVTYKHHVQPAAGSSIAAVIFSLAVLVVSGFYLPEWLYLMLTRAAAIVKGGV